MPDPVIPLANNDIVEVSQRGYYQGQRIITVLHYRWLAATLTDGVLQLINLRNDMNDPVIGPFWKMRQAMNNQFTATEYRVQIIYPTRSIYLSEAVTDSGARTASTPLPANTAAVIVKRCNVATRGRHGGIHITALNAGDQSSGNLTAGYVSLLQPIADVVWKDQPDTASADSWRPVTWSRSKPAAPAIVIGGYVGEHVRIMRRRTVGLGE